MFSSQSSTRTFICFIIPTTIGPEALRATQNTLLKCLQEAEESATWNVKPVSVITIVGSHLDRFSSQTATILNALNETPILALAEGPSGHNLSIVVDFEYGEGALDSAHAAILNND
jgi:aspartokinase